MNPITIRDVIVNQQLTPVYQPIVDLTEPAVYGYEALIRGPRNTPLASPKALFDSARENGMLVRLEYLCIEIACREFFSRNIDGKLFINISPMNLINPHTDQHIVELFQTKLGIDKSRIVIELSEQYPIEDYSIVSEALHYLRNQDFELAIDDLGAGYSSLRAWSEFKPEFVKIDRHFIDGIDQNSVNHEFVRSIQEISRSVGTRVIAEGIETQTELKTLCSLGITHGQGFYLGKPDYQVNQGSLDKIKNTIQPLKQFIFYRHDETVADLMEYSEYVTAQQSMSACSELIESRPELNFLPVLQGKKPIGMVTRQKILEVFFSRYGRELHSKKSVRNFSDKNVLIVEQSCSLSEASRMFTSKSDMDMSSSIIVTHQGDYVGIVNPKKLLEKITQQQIMSARYANPLTMLPGNVPIYEWIDDLLSKQQPFKLAYFDLNNFKPYNDIYGYSRGDKVITLVADVLKRHINPDVDRLGHIGGDDFVIVFTSEDWHRRCDLMLSAFREEIKSFYNAEDLANNGIYSNDRRGQRQFFAILSIAAGIVDPDPMLCHSHHDVANLATDAKHQAKKMGGNALYISRRRGNDRDYLMADHKAVSDSVSEESIRLDDYGT